jgi:histidinol-phosphate aminotransferase
MRKVKDSYNCDTLSLAAGIAALDDQPWMRENAARIRATRRRLTTELERIGFSVVPSQANFVWATHARRPHMEIYETLKQRKILVRFMRFADVDWAPDGLVTGLRISIGTDSEIDSLLSALREII